MSNITPRAVSTFCCARPTPFTSTGSLDVPALRAHFARQAAAGVGVYVAGSSPGEGYALSRSEIWRCLEIAVHELRGRAPVRSMGVASRTARDMVEQVELAAECGVDAVETLARPSVTAADPTPGRSSAISARCSRRAGSRASWSAIPPIRATRSSPSSCARWPTTTST